MKNIFLIIVICFFTNSILGQSITLPQITTDLCDDGGFETNNLATWGWTMVQYQKSGPTINPGELIFNSIISGIGSGNIKDSSFSCSFNGLLVANTRWELVSSGSDPIYPSLPTTHSGNKALRLGRIETAVGLTVNNGAEAIQKKIIITESNKNLSFWYALVLEDPMGDPSHSNIRSPAFGVRIYTNATTVGYIPILPNITSFPTIPITSNSAGVANPFWDSAITQRGQFNNANQTTRIRPWTCGSVDLSGYLGQTITIEFVVNDCSQTGHFGYAYLDDICMGCAGSDMGDASLNGISSGCGPTAIVDGSYTLPYNSSSTGTLNSITATLYQNGTPVGTSISIPPANINTTAKTFNFPMSIFGTVPAGDYDIVITASFTFLGSTYSTISDLAGLIPLTNNDWEAECPTPVLKCCNNTFSVVSATVIPPSYPYNGGTYSIEDFNVNVPNNIPLTEIKVNVESFEILSAFKDCIKCDNKPVTLGSLFGISKIGTAPNVLTLTTQPYGTGNNVNINNNELIWSNLNGVTLNTTDKISVVYLLPSSNDIPCCATKAKVCIRISWRDTNCNYCEAFTCSTIDLKNPKDLKPGFKLPQLHTLWLNARGIFGSGHANGF